MGAGCVGVWFAIVGTALMAAGFALALPMRSWSASVWQSVPGWTTSSRLSRCAGGNELIAHVDDAGGVPGVVAILPVVESAKPVGIVSLGDLALGRDPESVLADISAAPPNI